MVCRLFLFPQTTDEPTLLAPNMKENTMYKTLGRIAGPKLQQKICFPNDSLHASNAYRPSEGLTKLRVEP